MFAYRNHPVARERMEKTEEVTTGAKPLRRKRNGIQIDCGGSGFCPDEGPWPTKAFIRPCSLADLEPPSPLHLFLGYPSARSQGPPGPKIIRLSLSPSPTTPHPPRLLSAFSPLSWLSFLGSTAAAAALLLRESAATFRPKLLPSVARGDCPKPL